MVVVQHVVVVVQLDVGLDALLVAQVAQVCVAAGVTLFVKQLVLMVVELVVKVAVLKVVEITAVMAVAADAHLLVLDLV